MSPNLKPSVTGGILFPQAARTSFVDVTRTRYDGMVQRLKKKKLPALTFTLEQFRQDVLSVMDGKEDGAIQCRFCKRWYTLSEIAVDHATPLSRGGSAGLDNLDYPCRQCNDRKGSLTTAEYMKLVIFLEGMHPLMQKDVLSRLEKANKLAAGARRLQMLQQQLAGKGKTKPPAEAEEELEPF